MDKGGSARVPLGFKHRLGIRLTRRPSNGPSVTIVIVLVALHSSLLSANSAAGVGKWTSNGPGRADVISLAIDPSRPATLYAGTNGSGVFKSTDGGGNWAAVSTGLTSSTVSALAIDPSAPDTLSREPDGPDRRSGSTCLS